MCDVLAALLRPRPERTGTPIDPDVGHTCVQLAFGQFNPASERATLAAKVLHDALAAPLHQRTVVSWGGVVSHLARSRFDQLVNEFIERIHPCKTADEVYHILVGVQRVTIPHLSAPACAPYFDQFRQMAQNNSYARRRMSPASERRRTLLAGAGGVVQLRRLASGRCRVSRVGEARRAP